LPPFPHRNITLLISGPVVAFVEIQSLSCCATGAAVRSTGIDREKFDFPADFRSVREGLGTRSRHLKTLTGGLENPDGRSGRAQAELGADASMASLEKLRQSRCGDFMFPASRPDAGRLGPRAGLWQCRLNFPYLCRSKIPQVR
jgi:hypothetical protein